MICPDIEQLLAPRLRAGIDEHAACCDACGGIIGLAELREQISDKSPDACVEAEILIAKREVSALPAADKQLLLTHLEQCSDCNELAVRMASLPSPVREATSVDAHTGVDQVPPGRDRKRPPLSWWVGAAAAAALAGMLGLGLGLVLDRNEPPAVAASEVSPTVETRPAAGPQGVSPALAPFPAPPTPQTAAAPQPTSPPVAIGSDDDVDPDVLLNPYRSKASSKTSADTGYLTIVCAPSCDRVDVAGRNLGRSPVVRSALPAGRHAVVLRRGRQTKLIRVDIIAGQTAARRVAMGDATDVRSDDSERSGSLSVTCTPSCTGVRVDREDLGTTPIVRHALSPGTYSVLLSRDQDSAKRVVNIPAGKHTALNHRWTQTSTTCDPPYYIGANGVKRLKPACTSSDPGY